VGSCLQKQQNATKHRGPGNRHWIGPLWPFGKTVQAGSPQPQVELRPCCCYSCCLLMHVFFSSRSNAATNLSRIVSQTIGPDDPSTRVLESSLILGGQANSAPSNVPCIWSIQSVCPIDLLPTSSSRPRALRQTLLSTRPLPPQLLNDDRALIPQVSFQASTARIRAGKVLCLQLPCRSLEFQYLHSTVLPWFQPRPRADTIRHPIRHLPKSLIMLSVSIRNPRLRHPLADLLEDPVATPLLRNRIILTTTTTRRPTATSQLPHPVTTRP
jgi:hypothetical protein